MKNYLYKLIVRNVYARRQTFEIQSDNVTKYQLAKEYITLKSTIKKTIRDFFLILIGIFSAAFGVKGFLFTNKFIDGGVTGVSLLITAVTGLPLSIFIFILNLPFIILGYNIIGKMFALKTTLAITTFAFVLATVHFPNVTDDNLLVAIFGGFFLGAGIGFAVRGGCVIDGTEVLAIYLSKKLRITMGDVIIIINAIIFSAAAYLLSVEIALYSMITYLAASKTLDFIIEGIEEYIGVTIISPKHEEIRLALKKELGRGSTVYSGKKGYGKRGDTRDVDIIFSVITRLELNKLHAEIDKIDPNAFVVMTPVKDTKGGMIKQRPLK